MSGDDNWFPRGAIPQNCIFDWPNWHTPYTPFVPFTSVPARLSDEDVKRIVDAVVERMIAALAARDTTGG